jgi:hypothetical protein
MNQSVIRSKPEYYAVIWGDDKRLTNPKVSSPDAAKRQCYGMATDDMVAVALGARKAEAFKAYKSLKTYAETPLRGQ